MELCTYNIVLLLHFDNKHHLPCFIAFAGFALSPGERDPDPVDCVGVCFFLAAGMAAGARRQRRCDLAGA